MSTGIREAAAEVSVNALAAPRVAELIAAASRLRLGVAASERGATIVDAGIAVRGGLEAGRRIAEICMGGLGSVQRLSGDGELGGLTEVQVHSADPVIACLASQYAGWSLAHGEGKGAFRALASGPGRAIARSGEPLFDELGYADRFDRAVFVLEVDRVPPEPNGRQDRAWLRARTRAHHRRPDADEEPRGHGTDRGPGTRGRDAQGARARLRARSHVVDGTGAAPLPPPAAPGRDGAHQRCDPLRGAGWTLYVDSPRTPTSSASRKRCPPSGLARLRAGPSRRCSRITSSTFTRSIPMLFARLRGGSSLQSRFGAELSPRRQGAISHGSRSRSGVDERRAFRGFMTFPRRVGTGAGSRAGSRRSASTLASSRSPTAASIFRANRYGIVLPGFKGELPDGVFVAREIAGGEPRAGHLPAGDPACAGRVGGTGLQQRPRNRTHRRQRR